MGRPASGLKAPAWWGEPSEYPGAVLSGAALEHVGVAAPIVNPDQVVLFHAKEVASADG